MLAHLAAAAALLHVSRTLIMCLIRSAAAASGGDDPGDAFFEFTAEDAHRIAAQRAQRAQRAEAGLRTGRLREAEEARRAAALPPVPIRVHLPGGAVLQVGARALAIRGVLVCSGSAHGWCMHWRCAGVQPVGA